MHTSAFCRSIPPTSWVFATFQHHEDPFDHLLIAQAIAEGTAFVSADRHAPLYPLEVVTCRPH